MLIDDIDFDTNEDENSALVSKKTKITSKKKIKSIFDGLDDLNPDNCVLSDNALSKVKFFIDTGSYALNAICSGSCYGGIPGGRVTGLAGPSGCGKTLMASKILKNFLNMSPDNRGIIFDSEAAYDEETVTRMGIDPSRVHYFPIETVVSLRNQVLKILRNIIDTGEKDRYFIIIDSLGNLAGEKEINDAMKNSFAADMGLRARDIKGLLRAITIPAAKSGTTILFTNHTYEDPSALYPTAVKPQSGGTGPIYLASLLIQLSFKRERADKDYKDEEMIEISKNVNGITMTSLTTKNRIVPPMLTTSVYLNFKTGLDRYSGLFEMGKDLGVITGERTYAYEGGDLGYRKNFERDPEIWNKKLLPILEKTVNEKFTFHSESDNIEGEVSSI